MLLRPFRAAAAALPLLAWGCGPVRPASPAPVAPVSLEAGVSLELARHRAATLAAVEYDLRLDLTGTERVPGTVTVSVQRRADAGDLVLDYRGPALHEVQANGRELTDYLWRQGHVVIPARHLRAGPNTVHLAFTAAMAAAGTSIIRFVEPAEGPEQRRDTYLYTLLVPADANQLFPSFDQPDLKAVFRMELLAPPEWRVLANAPAARGARGALALRALAGSRSTSHGVPLREARHAARPAFPFGGMEHVGAIFYNESALHLPRAADAHRAAGPGRDHLPRGRAPVVRRPGHHGVVRRPLAEGGILDLHGGEDAGVAAPRHRRVEDVLPAQQAARLRRRRTRAAPPRSGRSCRTWTWPRATTARSSTTRRPRS
jgi:hypothetical protein